MSEIRLHYCSHLTAEEDEVYPNTVSPRGMALIIENVNFVRFSQSTGSWADSSKMKRLLADMEYTVIYKRNLDLWTQSKALRGVLSMKRRKDISIRRTISTAGVRISSSLLSGVPQIMSRFEEVVGNLCRERESYNKRMAALENEIDQQLLVAEKKAREEGLIFKYTEIARENRKLKNNLSENHLEMTLTKAKLVEIKSEYENRTLLMALEQEHEQPSAAEAQQIQRQLQLL
uniref:CASPASE_P20 domain-containing protein n=1 Tax=Globodera pallida TaxID=36090 RepID=A0A183BSJ1_GLOPA